MRGREVRKCPQKRTPGVSSVRSVANSNYDPSRSFNGRLPVPRSGRAAIPAGVDQFKPFASANPDVRTCPKLPYGYANLLYPRL